MAALRSARGWTGLAATALLSCVLLLQSAGASAAQLTASWVDNSGGTATTRVERRAAAETVYSALADVSPGETAFADTSVAGGGTYCYRVFAWLDVAVSPYTDEVCATAAGDSVAVSVTKTGAGSGTVTSAPAGISCGSACSMTVAPGTLVTLTATPASGSVFDGWTSGGCSGTGPCSFATNVPVAVTASFSAAPVPPPPVTAYALTVTKKGPGTVVSSPAGIDCGASCVASFPAGSTVTLTAQPSKSAPFGGWSGGGCSGSALTCTLTVNGPLSVTATFRGR